jgi:hypothetical protein
MNKINFMLNVIVVQLLLDSRFEVESAKFTNDLYFFRNVKHYPIFPSQLAIGIICMNHGNLIFIFIFLITPFLFFWNYFGFFIKLDRLNIAASFRVVKRETCLAEPFFTYMTISFSVHIFLTVVNDTAFQATLEFFANLRQMGVKAVLVFEYFVA